MSAEASNVHGNMYTVKVKDVGNTEKGLQSGGYN